MTAWTDGVTALSPALWWRLSEISGGSVLDEIVGKTASAVGGADLSLSTGVANWGSGIALDGSGYLNLGNLSPQITGNIITIIWAMRTTTTEETEMGSYQHGFYFAMNYPTSGEFEVGASNFSQVHSGPFPNNTWRDGDWHLWALSFNVSNGQIVLRFDKTIVYSDTVAAGSLNMDGALYWGAAHAFGSPSGFLDGDLDEIIFLDYIPTPQQMDDLYDSAFAAGGEFDPANLDVTIVGSTAQLSYDASPGVDGYKIFRRTPQTGANFDPSSDTPIATVTGLTYDDEGLAAGDYDWQVFGYVDF